jgi:hypothetical protein
MALLHPLRSEAVKATSLVYFDTGRLLLRPPGQVAFHRKGRSEWPRYIPDPEIPWASKIDPEHDRERHWTYCGLLTYDSRHFAKTVIAGIRHDNAILVGRPCKRCFP